jgi:hypothetical protein
VKENVLSISILNLPKEPLYKRGNRGELVRSEAEGNPLGDAILENKKRIFGFGRCPFLIFTRE